MVDVVTLRNIAQEVRSFAVQIRCNNQAAPDPTARLDAGLLERAATEMEDAFAVKSLGFSRMDI